MFYNNNKASAANVTKPKKRDDKRERNKELLKYFQKAIMEKSYLLILSNRKTLVCNLQIKNASNAMKIEVEMKNIRIFPFAVLMQTTNKK